MADASDKSQKAATWGQQFDKAREHDEWGDRDEAETGYRRMLEQIRQAQDTLGASERDMLDKACSCLMQRLKVLSDPMALDGISSSEMRILSDSQVFRRAWLTPGASFPPALKKYAGTSSLPAAAGGRRPAVDGDSVIETLGGDGGGGGAAAAAGAGAGGDKAAFHGSTTQTSGTLLPKIAKGGMTPITVHIDRIGLKDAEIYIDPFINVYVIDAVGNIVEREQSTPGPTRRGRWSHSAVSFREPIVIPHIKENGVRINVSAALV
jgi:hypothetical protein